MPQFSRLGLGDMFIQPMRIEVSPLGMAFALAGNKHLEPRTMNMSPRSTQKAEIDLGVGKASMHVRARTTPAGLLATGGLVGGILLSVTALVWAATSVKRKHPITSALIRR